MTQNRIFTREQLDELGTRTLERTIKAIDEGDPEKAKKLARRIHGELINMHDIAVNFVTAVLTFVGNRYGDEVLHEAMVQGVGSYARQMLGGYVKEENPARKLQILVSGLMGHGQALRIDEDDEKFTVTLQPCGSGGMLVRRGGYNPPLNLLKVKRAQLMTYGRADFPVFCSHCFYHEFLTAQDTGMVPFALVPGEKPGEDPCRILLYKDSKAMPEEFYKRVGREKPEP